MSVCGVDSRWKLRLVVLGLLVILRTYGIAQESINAAPAVPSKANENLYSLSGTLVNSVTGEPVRRAAVQITGQAGSATLTDDAGHFLFEGLAEGQVIVTPMKPGFYESEPGANAVVVGRDSAAITLKMTPCGAIVGRVTTRDGKPLEGFRIALIAKQAIGGHATWAERPNQGVTNEDGEFRIGGLQADHYYVVVNQGEQTTLGERGVANAREQGYARVVYPGVSDLAAASAVEVIPGRETEANFSLMAEPLYQVSGVVTPAVTGLALARKTGGEDDFSVMAVVGDGKFQAKLPAGAYVASGVTAEGVSVSTAGASVVVSADSADVHIPLAATASIPVKILTEPAGASARERVPVEQIPGLRIELDSTSHIPQLTRWRGPSGGIENVAPGTYTLHVFTMGNWWVKSAQYGGVDLLSDDLTVGESGSSMPIEVLLRDDGGQVSGTVAGAEQWSPVMVLLVQARSKKNNVVESRMMMGNFSFQGVAPGDYEIVAIDGADQVEYANPDVLNLYLSSAQQIHVPPHGNVSVNLTATAVRR